MASPIGPAYPGAAQAAARNAATWADKKQGEATIHRALVADPHAPMQPAGNTGFLSEVERALAAGDPAYAIAMIRRAKTGGKMDMSSAGDFRESVLGKALQMYLAMQMPNSDGSFVGDPVGQASQGLQDIVGGATNGQGFSGVLRGQASNLLGQDFSGLKDDQILKMLSAVTDSAGLGYGDFAGYASKNALDQAQNTAYQSTLGGGTTNVLGQPGALQTFQQLLQQYLGTH